MDDFKKNAAGFSPAPQYNAGGFPQGPGARSSGAGGAAGGPPPGASPLPQVSMPKGGGAIRGIGEKISANPVTGTGAMSVPIAASPGRSGFGPQLALSYDSGAGNGPFGFGWCLSLPSITRKTDKGLPRYLDRQDSDVFILSGAEDLVPVDDETRDGYKIRRYRPRTEGLFARIERWTNLTDGAVHWRSISKENITTIYGRTANSRIQDPADRRRIFSWLICESHDDKGNALVYEYKEEEDAGVYKGQAHEGNRTRTANRYLKRIKYGNRAPCLNCLATETWLTTAFIDTTADWMFELVLDYGDHNALTPAPDQTWPVRQDPFSVYRSGFEVRTYRLCRRTLMFHHFPDETGVGANCLVSSTGFAYEQTPTASYLTKATQTGYKGTAQAGYTSKSLPDLEFEYTRAEINQTVRELDVESLQGIPAGLGAGYHFVDLDGEGSSGILAEQGGGWFYKRNRSPINYDPEDAEKKVTADFEPPAYVSNKPNTSLSGGARLVDLAGDGQLDVVDFSPLSPGFYERDDEEGWARFRAFESLPNIDFNDPNLRLVDLTGDGHADILVTEHQVFTWYPSLGEKGFGPPELASKPWDEEQGPTVVFADSAQTIFLGDMSGDGLVDLVRIRNSEVCYWPNLGYGRFGAKVTMDDSPLFDHPELFDSKRIRLADIDGSGTIDILYLGAQVVTVYLNQAGNRWSAGQKLYGYPAVNNLNDIQALDLLGIGTACLVWSSPLPGASRSPLRYIDLMGGVKPHLMTKSKNNMGAETKVTYAPSTRFYLEDRAAGKPWITKIPFVVHVIDRVETRDLVSGNRFVTRYAYHHGHFDSEEREFRGFGMVEQIDTEEYGYQEGDTNWDEASAVPPVLTKTWFHTGAFIKGAAISRHFESEYFRESGWSDEDFEKSLLPDTVLPQGIPVAEIPEACRALRGSVLRREVYALDGSDKAGLPYSVTEQNYTMKRLQARGKNRHAVFFVHPRESIDYQYERNVSDPRIKHALTLEVDDWGNVEKSVAIGYGRTQVHPDLAALENDPNLNLAAQYTNAQTATHLVYTENDFTNAIDNPATDPNDYRPPLPCQVKTYELGNPDKAGNVYAFDEIFNAVITENPDEIPFEHLDPEEGEKRLVEHSRVLYRANDLSGPLSLGELESLALPYESYTKILTPGMLSAEPDPPYENLVDSDMLEEGGYVDLDEDGNWWIHTGRIFFAPDPLPQGYTDEEDYARKNFYLPRRFRDPFYDEINNLSESIVEYDDYNLLVTASEDALANQVEVQNDYRVLAPSMITDPNENRAAVAFDELGMVVKTAVMGKDGAGEGDDLDHPTTTFEYDLTCFFTDGKPVYAKYEARETHYYPDEPDPDDHPRITMYTYSDGFGREIQTKVQAEPSLAPHRDANGALVYVDGELDLEHTDDRWVGTGRTVFNNKGLPVKKYEPFFASSPEYEPEPDLTDMGVTPILFYDPLGRAVGTLHPDHTYEKTVFDPWKQETWDRNDTYKYYKDGDENPDPKEDPDVGGFFARLDDSLYGDDHYPDYHGEHAGTPARVYFDALGRPFFSIASNKLLDDGDWVDDERFYLTHTKLDIEGNALKVTVTRDTDTSSILMLDVMTTDYDVAGRPIRTVSPDAGQRILFPDITGNPLHTWDSREHHFHVVYDALRRPIETWLTENSVTSLISETVFGDSDHVDAPGDPASINSKGRPYITRDGAGKTVFTGYDFKGNLISSTNQLLTDYKNTVNWNADPEPTLETESFTTSMAYDALNRVIEKTTPDGHKTIHTFNEAGFLEVVDVLFADSTAETPFVVDIDYNARGQRTSIEYGNGAVTQYEYDEKTFRLTNLTTTADSTAIQDLTFTFDPVGNIEQIEEDAQQTVFFNNTPVSAKGEYKYDALYRLIEAKGREHPGQQPGAKQGPGERTYFDIPHPNDTDALLRYTEQYAYDEIGNILQLKHLATDDNWTQDYAYAAASNRLEHTTIGQTTLDYTHDSHGNMDLPHLTVQTWDHLNQLKSTSNQSVGSGTPETTYYVYDASGQRVRKVTENYAEEGNTPTRKCETLYISGFEIFRDYVDDVLKNERQTLHINAPSAGSGQANSGRIAMVETKTWIDGDEVTSLTHLQRYQLSNHLGSASIELDEDAQVITYDENYPFGGTSFHSAKSSTGLSQKRFRYNGKEKDEESGLYYYGARYYAAWLGRWTAADPAGFVDGLNVYAYVRNNPVRYLDRSGNRSDESLALQSDKKINTITPEQQHALSEMLKGAGGRLLQIGKDVLDRAVNSPIVNPIGNSIQTIKDVKNTYEALKTSTAEHGGGAGGLYKAVNEQYNPVYRAVESGFEAKWAADMGDYRDAGAHAVDSVLEIASSIGTGLAVAKMSPVPHKKPLNWKEHENDVGELLKKKYPDTEIGRQVVLSVEGPDKIVKICADYLYQGKSGSYQIVDAKFSEKKNLAKNKDKIVFTDNQQEVYDWIKNNEVKSVTPVGRNAERMGLDAGVEIGIEGTVHVYVNWWSGFSKQIDY